MPYKDKFRPASPWMGQVKIGGKKIRRRFKTKREAAEWEATAADTLESCSPTSTVSLADWATAYLDFSKEKFVKKTYDEKVSAFKIFFQAKGIKPDMAVNDLAPLVILKHFQHQARIRTGSGANKDRKNLMAAWNWGIRFLDLPESNPFRRAGKQSETQHVRRVPTMAEFMKVYNMAFTDQDRRMLTLYLYSGARRDEIFRMTWTDVDFINQKIRLYWRKNRLGTWRSAWLGMTEEAMQALREQHQETGNHKWVFIEPQTGGPYQYRLQWLRRLCEKAGVERFGFHGIRHLCASILAEKNVPLIDIQHHLRHDHLSTTERYVHRLKENRSVIAALTGLREAFSVCGPPKAHQTEGATPKVTAK